MSSYQIFKYGYLALFIVSIPLFFFAIRPDQFSLNSLLFSLALSMPSLLYIWIRVSFIDSKQFNYKGFYTSTSLYALIFLFLVVSISLLSIDISSLRISREVNRETTIFVRLINLHLALFLFACVYHFSKRSNNQRGAPFILILCLLFSLFISYMEGRRTAILIPIILLGLFSVTSTSQKLSIKKTIFYCALFVIVFMAITIVRSGSDVDIGLVFRAILSRLFNTGHMALAVIEQRDFNFDPETIPNIIERLGYTFGFNSYSGNTHQFGVYYGFIRPGTPVGINPGMIVESFLAFGYFGFFIQILIIEMTLILIKLYKKIFFRADLFIILLILHGMQMEIPYTFGVIAKLYVLGFVINNLKHILPSKKIISNEI